MENNILEIQNIHKSFALNYAGRGQAMKKEFKNVIDGLSIDIARGDVTALIGGNGTGKTTLFNLISGLLRPDDGMILFRSNKHDVECTNASPWRIASAGIGRMFQGTRIYGELTVMDHLLLQSLPVEIEWPFYNIFRAGKTKSFIREAKEKIMNELGAFSGFDEIIREADHIASRLSFAQQRMLSLAGLICGDYQLLLLDEPSSGLNPDSFGLVYKVIERMRDSGKTVFLIEHNMDFVREVAGMCHYMSEGKVLYSGSPESILDKDEVRQSYLL